MKHRRSLLLLSSFAVFLALATPIVAQAVAYGMHRQDSPQDIVIFVVIGVALLALLPAKQPSQDGEPNQ